MMNRILIYVALLGTIVILVASLCTYQVMHSGMPNPWQVAPVQLPTSAQLPTELLLPPKPIWPTASEMEIGESFFIYDWRMLVSTNGSCWLDKDSTCYTEKERDFKCLEITKGLDGFHVDIYRKEFGKYPKWRKQVVKAENLTWHLNYIKKYYFPVREIKVI